MTDLPPLPTPYRAHGWVTGYREEDMRSYALAAVQAERERCIERVKTCLYLDWEGNVLAEHDANAEILRCVAAIRGKMQKQEPFDMDGRC